MPPTAWTCLHRRDQPLNQHQQSQLRGASDGEHKPKRAATAPYALPQAPAMLILSCPCVQVSSEDGIVACFDARKGANSDALYRLSAHDHATCALSFSSAAPGLLATCSTDKQVQCAAIACVNSCLLGATCMLLLACPVQHACSLATLSCHAGEAVGRVHRTAKPHHCAGPQGQQHVLFTILSCGLLIGLQTGC